MMDRNLARNIVGIIGNVISMGLFLSPMPTIMEIIKMKSVQKYKPYTYIATLLNCMMWVFYGMPFVHPNSTLVITVNGAGFFLEVFYIAVFFVYTPIRRWKKMIVLLLIEVVGFVGSVALILIFVHGTHLRTIVVGTFCVAFNIYMYTTPLTIMKSVIRTKSVKYMSLLLSLANLCNGLVWLCYALIKFDPWIAIPNGLGAISGAIQIILYAVYYKSTNWEKTDVEVANG